MSEDFSCYKPLRYYDALGRRTSKSVVKNGQTEIRKYVYDNQEIIAELDGGNNTLVKYTHSGMRTDDVLAMDVTSMGVAAGFAPTQGTYHFLKDGLGSVIDITNSAGSIVQHYVYSSFGKLLKIENSGTDNTTNPEIKSSYSYTNREYDQESGLYYYRARYYDAHSGRFLQEDAHPGVLGLPMSYNSKYTYAHNSPVRYTDPSGKIIPAILIGALLGGTINSLMNTGSFWSNFLVGAIAGGVGGGVGALVGIGIGATTSLAGAIFRGAAIGASASTAATTTSLILSGENLSSSRSLGKIALSGLIGAVAGGAAGAWSFNTPKVATKVIEVGVPVQSEIIDQGSQQTFDFFHQTILGLECAPLLRLENGSYEACMGQ